MLFQPPFLFHRHNPYSLHTRGRIKNNLSNHIMATSPTTPEAYSKRGSSVGPKKVQRGALKRTFTGVMPNMTPAWMPTQEALPLWLKYTAPDANDIESIQKSFCFHVVKSLARQPYNMDEFAAYQAAALSVRDRLLDRWNATTQYQTSQDPKRVYYLSLEFLMGRFFDNAMLNLGLKKQFDSAIGQLGFNVEDLIDNETDAALGNGGLGRLAACFMDSLATLDYPGWGYGIRYEYGIFKQKIIDGYQVEVPDYWLSFGNPFEIERVDVTYDVRFRGWVRKEGDAHVWEGGERIMAVAHDVPIPGFGTENCNNIRLWSSKPQKEFDFTQFNEGNYDRAVEEQKAAENISAVLYPNDNFMLGKILRLKQQYFFVCASLQDIIRRFKKLSRPWSDFPSKAAIQLNDTHPVIGVVELQRILVDEEGMAWNDAWAIVTETFSYTNHTVLPEALEKWAVPLIAELLPRHMMIIYDINYFFVEEVKKRFPGDQDRVSRMSLIQEGYPQNVRMAFLAIVGSHKVNGVAQLHSDLIKLTIFKDFVDFYGADKFINVTNGVTPRRWLNQCNPKLSDLITRKLGNDNWIKHLDQLANLRKFADDKSFEDEFMAIKHANKVRLATYIKHVTDIDVPPHFMFDIQVKRMHEYKRQLMNILGVIYRYSEYKKMSPEERAKETPHAVMLGGKAAPGYFIAKLVIKLINAVAEVVNNDPDVKDILKVVFLPNYNVSFAEIIIPANDISQHISTAGTEASGTSNMKFVLNGGVILGTVDGANIEIGEEVGKDNIFFFGVLTPEVEGIRHANKQGQNHMNPKVRAVCDMIRGGMFGESRIFDPLLNTIEPTNDYYLVNADFDAYLDAHKACRIAYQDKAAWAKKAIMCTAGMGKFSSDRSMDDYARDIWHIKPLPVPAPKQ